MANTTVTGTTNSIKVVFDEDSSLVGNRNKGTFNKATIENVLLNGDHVEVITAHDPPWMCDYQANSKGYIVIDSVNAIAPVSLDDLYVKISALIE